MWLMDLTNTQKTQEMLESLSFKIFFFSYLGLWVYFRLNYFLVASVFINYRQGSERWHSANERRRLLPLTNKKAATKFIHHTEREGLEDQVWWWGIWDGKYRRDILRHREDSPCWENAGFQDIWSIIIITYFPKNSNLILFFQDSQNSCYMTIMCAFLS